MLQAEGLRHAINAFCTGSLRLVHNPGRWGHLGLRVGCTEPWQGEWYGDFWMATPGSTEVMRFAMTARSINYGRCGEFGTHLWEWVITQQTTWSHCWIMSWVLSKQVEAEIPDMCLEEISIPECRRVWETVHLWKWCNVTVDKPESGPSTVSKSKRLPKAAKLSRMPVPLQPAGVNISCSSQLTGMWVSLGCHGTW